MGSSLSRTNKKKCGIIEDAEKIRIDSSPLHCPICFSVFQKAPEILPCGHSHCTDCLDRLERYSQSSRTNETEGAQQSIECPLCRTRAWNKRHRIKNYAIEAILDSLETYEPEEDSTSDVIATLNLSIKRLTLQNAELERRIDLLTAQLKSYKKFGSILLLILIVGSIIAIFRLVHT